MKRFSDNVKLLLKKCQIPPGQLKALVTDRLVWRDVWRDICKDGLVTFTANYDKEAEARRLRRHTVSSPPISDCAVMYASTIVRPQRAQRRR